MRVMRARYARRETADARSVLGWPGIVFAAASMLILATPANAQESANVGALSGTLKKVKDTGTITLGYRESSLPFSYLNRRQQPIGYSIDLCREIVEDVSTELDGLEIKITFAPVTPANRLQKVASGEIDLECGSTTGNVQRRKEVAFSPIFFVAGTKLMVPKSSSVSSYRDLAGKTAVVTSGTTNEAALRTLSDKQKLGITIITAPDHAQSLEMLASGKADAFATDDVLLYGFIAMARMRAT
jgi:glutamate/aspartate transport system substrate-binding protein